MERIFCIWDELKLVNLLLEKSRILRKLFVAKALRIVIAPISPKRFLDKFRYSKLWNALSFSNSVMYLEPKWFIKLLLISSYLLLERWLLLLYCIFKNVYLIERGRLPIIFESELLSMRLFLRKTCLRERLFFF